MVDDPQVRARVIAGLILLLWCAVWPFLPQDRMSEPLYVGLVRIQPLAITGLAIWAFCNHLLRRRWLAAFLLTPVLSFLLTIATGVVMMLTAVLAGGRVPI